MKYIKLATSFNFGEVMSVIIASILLPFLPETPIQLLVEGLLYDFGQLTLPFDNVDNEYLEKPRKFDITSLKHFMLYMGTLSSIFDLIVFASLLLFFKVKEVALFQTVWFTYSIVSNLLGMHIIRTAKIPFIQSNAHKFVYYSSIADNIDAGNIKTNGAVSKTDVAKAQGDYFGYCIAGVEDIWAQMQQELNTIVLDYKEERIDKAEAQVRYYSMNQSKAYFAKKFVPDYISREEWTKVFKDFENIIVNNKPILV